jgi:hypothetical protein
MERVLSYKAGTASVCITPDEPLWLAGYAARTTPARGKISDLYAGALALEDESGYRFAIASIDSIAVTRQIADAVAHDLQRRRGLSREQILLAATHSHYAPEFRPDKQVFFNIPDEYAAKFPEVGEKLMAALTHVVDQAFERLEPVRLFVRQSAADFGHNRRRRGVVAGTASTEDVRDRDVPVLECVDSSGDSKAIVFGYACHNTTIPLEDGRYCGDWAGFARAQLERDNPSATALFIAGAGADQNPEPHGSLELSQQHGREIADAVQAALGAPATEIMGPLQSRFEDVPLALTPVTTRNLKDMSESDDRPQRVKAKYLLDQIGRGEELIKSYSVPIQVVRFGDKLVMVALSGEPVVDWSLMLKQELAQNWHDGEPPYIWVAGYCNDMFGYLPTRRVQAEGGYEGGRANLWSAIPAPFTKEAEDRVTAMVYQLVRRV